jgi:hypothetical protein
MNHRPTLHKKTIAPELRIVIAARTISWRLNKKTGRAEIGTTDFTDYTDSGGLGNVARVNFAVGIPR